MRPLLSSFAAFIAAGVWPRTPLAKAIVAVLIIKLAGITAARLFLFMDSARPATDAAAIERLIGAGTPVR